DSDIPLLASISVAYKPEKFFLRSKQIGIYRISGKSRIYLGGAFTNGRISFQTRDFGEFTILTDSVAPSIRPLSINSNTVRFRISDQLSGIDSYEATIDGEWLLMHYDAKTGSIWSERLDKSQPLKGDFVLTVVDNAGNKEVYTHNIP